MAAFLKNMTGKRAERHSNARSQRKAHWDLWLIRVPIPLDRSAM